RLFGGASRVSCLALERVERALERLPAHAHLPLAQVSLHAQLVAHAAQIVELALYPVRDIRDIRLRHVDYPLASRNAVAIRSVSVTSPSSSPRAPTTGTH